MDRGGQQPTYHHVDDPHPPHRHQSLPPVISAALSVAAEAPLSGAGDGAAVVGGDEEAGYGVRTEGRRGGGRGGVLVVSPAAKREDMDEIM